jgi:hypothetical protein
MDEILKPAEIRYKARLRMMHIGIGGSPETFEAIWKSVV